MEGQSISIKQQALTRPRFDDFHQADDMRITGYSLNYYLNPPAANCPTTFPVDATVRIQKSGASWPQGMWKTDVESDLKNINRLGTRVRSNGASYNPDTNAVNQVPLVPAPDESFRTFQSVNKSSLSLRATGWNRWQPMPHNPQLTFETPFDFFIPARSLDKEKWKTHGACFQKPDGYD